MIVENQAEIPILMKPLSGDSSDKTDFIKLVENHAQNLQKAHGIKYIVSDSAFYSAENIGRYSIRVHNVKWISRVPETINEVKKAIEQADIESMVSLNDDCKYSVLSSNYGSVPQRQMVVYSEHAKKRAVKTVNRKILKTGAQDIKAFKKLCRKKFACEADAKKVLKDYEKNLKCCEIDERSVKEILKYSGRGRPAKGCKANKKAYQIEGSLCTPLFKQRNMLKQKSCFIVAANESNTS